MSPLDLIRGRDGTMSLTKLAASTAHALMAAGFAHLTWTKGFISEMWITYGTFAIFHAVADKTGSQIAAFKTHKLDVETPGTTTTATVVTKETT